MAIISYGLVMHKVPEDSDDLCDVNWETAEFLSSRGNKIAWRISDLPYNERYVYPESELIYNPKDGAELAFYSNIRTRDPKRLINTIGPYIKPPIPLLSKAKKVMIDISVGKRKFSVHMYKLPRTDESKHLVCAPITPYPVNSLMRYLGMSSKSFAKLYQKALGHYVTKAGHCYYTYPLTMPGYPVGLLELTINPLNEKDKKHPISLAIKAYVDGLIHMKDIDVKPVLETLEPSEWDTSTDGYLKAKDKLPQVMEYLGSTYSYVVIHIMAKTTDEFNQIVDEVSH